MDIFLSMEGLRYVKGRTSLVLEAGYTIARLIQRFPSITVPAGDPVVQIGEEKQILTLVVASADVCRLQMQ